MIMFFPNVTGYDSWESIAVLKGEVDTVVAIPSKNSGHTIPYVIHNAYEGLSKLETKSLILVVDGLSADPTVEIVQVYKKTLDHEKLFIVPNTLSPGKGGAMKLAIDIAYELGASTLLFVDSDLRSIAPEWIMLLYKAAVKCGYATPYYVRDIYDATITNFVAKPLTTAAYLLNINQPIGGEFGLERKLIEHLSRRDPWISVYWNYLFGTDIFITHTALSIDMVPCEAVLGSKIHEAKDPGRTLKNMFIEVTGSLYNALVEYWRKWTGIMRDKLLELEKISDPKPVFMPPPRVRVDVENTFKIYSEARTSSIIKLVEKHKLFDPQQLKAKISRTEGLTIDEWAEILVNAYRAFLKTPSYTMRARILDALFHLWQGRLYSYYIETKSKTVNEIEKTLNEQTKKLVEKRDLLISTTIEYFKSQ